MKVMMKRARVGLLLACTMMLVALGLACEPGPEIKDTDSTPLPPGFVAQSLSSLVQGASLIVVGEVTDIRAGRTAGAGEGLLQFNDVQVNVERQLKGAETAAVVVEQLDTGGRPVSSEVGSPYRKDERYVLFLSPGEGDRHVTIIQGRYLLRGGRVLPTQPGLVSDNVKGMKEAEFIEGIESAR